MKLIPVVLSYSDAPIPTGAQLHAASRICANVALGFERMLGKVMEVGESVPVHVTDRATPYSLKTQAVANNVSIHPEIGQVLGERGYDISSDIYAVWLLGNPRDNSGVGNPTWTAEMYNTGRWGWNANANPTAGGLAVMGQHHLDNIIKMPYNNLTSAQRTVYYHAIWHGLHEIGHALGVHHTGYHPTNYPNGRPNDPTLMQASVMAYGPGYFRSGTMTTVGALPEELDTWARHRIFLPSPSLYLHIYVPDRNAILNNEINVRLGLGPGLLLEDYT